MTSVRLKTWSPVQLGEEGRQTASSSTINMRQEKHLPCHPWGSAWILKAAGSSLPFLKQWLLAIKVAPYPDYCFWIHIKVSQETGKMVWYSHLFKSFPQFVMIHTVGGFSVVDETEKGIFLEFPCFVYDPLNVGHLISGSSFLPKSSLYTWKFLVHMLLKPSLKDFKHYLASMWNCSTVCWAI